MFELLGYFAAAIVGAFVETLFYWGVGSLVTRAFSIDYNWSLLCGFVAYLFVSILRYIFSGKR